MNKDLRILIVEDLPSDAELLKYELRNSDIGFVSTVVDTPEAFLEALIYFRPDIVLSDYSMPQFDGMGALRLLKEHAPDIPFIIVTASMNEETAVECLKAGASDYIIKGHFRRIGGAMASALEKKLLKDKEALAETAMRESEERLRRITSVITDYIYTVYLEEGRAGRTVHSPSCLLVTGYSAAELNEDPDLWLAMVEAEEREMVRNHTLRILEGKDDGPIEHRIRRKDGTIRWVCNTPVLHRDSSGAIVSYDGVLKDITERKRAEEALRNQMEFMETMMNTIPAPIYYKDSSGAFLGCNMLYASTFIGLPKEKIVGRTILEMEEAIPADLAHKWHESDMELIHIPGFRVYDEDMPGRDGELRSSIYSKATYADAHGNVSGMVGIIMDITERKRAEGELKKSERNLAVRNSINEIFLTFSGQDIYREILKVVLEATSSRCGFFGSFEDDKVVVVPCLNRNMGENADINEKPGTFSWDAFSQSKHIFGRVMKEKKSFVSNMPIELIAGQTPMDSLLVVPVIFKKDIIGIIAASDKPSGYGEQEKGLLEQIASHIAPFLHARIQMRKDQSARMKAEQALRDSEAVLRSFYDSPGMMRGIVERTGEDILLISVNAVTADFFGKSREEMIYRKLSEMGVADDLVRTWISKSEESQTTLRPVCFEYMHTSGENETWLRAIVSFIGAAPSGNARFAYVVEDITERKRSERALIEEKTFTDAVINSFPGVFYVIDREGRFVRWNRQVAEVTGLAHEKINGAQAVTIIYDDDRPVISEMIAEVFVKGEAVSEARVVTAYNEVRPYLLTGRSAEIGGCPYLVGVGIDITERKRAEELLRRQGEVLEQSMDGIAMFDLSGAIEYVNPTWAAMHGYTKDELKGGSLDMFHTPQQMAEEVNPFLNQIRGNMSHSSSVEVGHVRRNGTVFPARMSVFILRDIDGAPVNMIAFARDITFEQRNENLLRQSQKMEAVGHLTGGIAHDFNNMLSPILGYADLLLSEMEPEGSHYQEILHIKQSAERAKDLTWQLLAYSRKQVLDVKTMDLRGIISDFQKILRRTIREDIAIKYVSGPTQGMIKADKGMITQILMNLAVNSQDAMPQGGTIIIETQDTMLDEAYTETHPDTKPGPYVLLAFSDTGSGIERHNMEHLFEPFFTTKESGKGTGLGLATVFGIVKQHGGHITVYSEPGMGTIFKIYLPREESPEDQVFEPREKEEIKPGTETVLVVEDEAEVREMTCRILRKHGYTVIDAGSSQECFKAMESHGGNIDMLISDVIMPGMNGKQLYENLASRVPGIKVIFISGYTHDVITEHGVLMEGVSFIQKPFTVRELTKKVRSVLDG